jgi:hypothetical protein
MDPLFIRVLVRALPPYMKNALSDGSKNPTKQTVKYAKKIIQCANLVVVTLPKLADSVSFVA